VAEGETEAQIFARLLSLRETRISGQDERVERILVEMRAQLVRSLRSCVDRLNQLDVADQPETASRINAETSWINTVILLLGTQ
jgi:hypothetical protein